MIFTNRKEINMTEGPLLSKIVLFVLPLMITNLLQVLYSAADMVIVSLSKDPDSVGAIGTTGAMINLILNIFIGFSIGANVIVAQNLGAGSKDRASKAVHTSICMSLIFGIAGMAVGLAFSRPILEIMGNAGNLLNLSTLYTQIYFIGVPFLAVTNYLIAILRAEGDTQTPLIILTATGLLNVILNLFFVLVLDMSVDGVAWATTISNFVSMIALIIRLSKDKGACRFSFRKLKIDGQSFKEILHIGLPAGIQGALFSLSNMLIQSSIIQVNNSTVSVDAAYQPVVKGNAAAGNLEGFAYTATNSVYQASVTFTGQNVGAQKYERIGSVMKYCYLVTFCVAVISSGFMLLLKDPLLYLYGVSQGAEGSLELIAYNTSTTRMTYMFTVYFLLAFMEVGSGVLRGLGRSVTSTVVSLMGSCVFRIVWIFTVFRQFPTLGNIYISYPISWGLTALIHLICSIIVLHRLKKKNLSAVEENKTEYSIK